MTCHDCGHPQSDFWCPRCGERLCATCSDVQGKECKSCRASKTSVLTTDATSTEGAETIG